MKKIIISVTVIIALLLVGWAFLSKDKNKPEFKTEKVERGNLVESITASGTVNPEKNVSVGTLVSGTIKEIYADYNSPVKKGQVLAQIDPAIIETQVAQAQANVYNAQANLQRIQSIMANDAKTYNRNKTLFEKNFIARSEVDLAESTYNADKAQISSARAQIAQASAGLRNNLTNLKYTKIVSPVNGIVVSRNVDIGQTVAASFQTPTLFLVAQDLTKMQIDTNMAEADIGKIKEGQDVEYTLDGYPDLVFKGKVKQIRIAPTTIQNVVTYDVVIKVDNKDLKLKPGMTANVSVITSRKNNVLLVSNASLRFTPFEVKDEIPRFKSKGVWILEEKKPQRIDIKTGISDGIHTEIMSEKLKEDQEVIVDKIKNNKKSRGAKSGSGMRML
jgi:HlyD family secretion protein